MVKQAWKMQHGTCLTRTTQGIQFSMSTPEKSEAIWTDFGYDIETFKNIFCIDITHIATGTRWIFEVSPRINQSAQLVKFLDWMSINGFRMVGFNNEGFDYLVLHHLISIFRSTGTFSCTDAYEKTKQLFALDWNDRFNHMIWPDQRLVKQVDLFKIHHFDNVARSTSLKKLEIAMRSWSVQDLPYDPDEDLTFEQMDKLIEYMCHDVRETIKFYFHSLAQIKFRDELSIKYNKDFTNANDTKIGKEFFKMELEKNMPGCTGTSGNPKQTIREQIVINDVILPYIQFRDPDFNQILDFFRGSSIKCVRGIAELKGFFEKLNCTVNGMVFHFGAGGLHASVSGKSFHATDEYDIIDVDVASYYPSLAIANGLYPMHLSERFCEIYLDVFNLRRSYPKKTAENAMLKLALNGVYGDSNNKHSPFFDPQYTMSITVNGQLLMAMLAEQVMAVAGVTIIQANTDGITCRVHKSVREHFMVICKAWEALTKLTLEYVDYERMFVRDVNNYIGDYGKGKLKRIGAYGHMTPLEDPYTREVQWHKNHSSLVVQKAAEAALVRGENPVDFINACTDPYLFMRSVKVPKSYQLMSVPGWRTDREPAIDRQGNRYMFDTKGKQKFVNVKYPVGEITKYQGTLRYYVTHKGVELTKHMPPLPATPTRQRYNAIDKGYLVGICNDVRDFNWVSLNRQFYVDEAMKLINAIN